MPARALAALLAKRDEPVEVSVTGPSMHPTIPDGGRIRIDFGDALPAPPEVVAFLAGGRNLTVHRLVARSRDGRYALTRGDANLNCDPPLPASDLVGVVRSVEIAGSWSELPPRPETGGLARGWAALNEVLMVGALRIHVRVAQCVAVLFLLPLAPRALLRTRRLTGSSGPLAMFTLDRSAPYGEPDRDPGESSAGD